MKIAIIDDCKEDRLELEKALENYLIKHDIYYELIEFHSAEHFFQDFVPNYYQLVFLDIYMDKMNGIEAAKRIYEKDKNCKLIFLSSSPDFSIESYSVRAVYYLLKPIDNNAFTQAMDFCALEPEYDIPYLKVCSNKQMISITTATILYIDFENRQTLIHFHNEFLPVSGSFSEITAPLKKDCRFLLCIRGILVNMQHITGVDDSMFLLDNGERIPINLRNRKQLIQTYRKFIFESMEH